MRIQHLITKSITIAALLLGTSAMTAPATTLAATNTTSTTNATSTLTTALTDTTKYVANQLTTFTQSNTNLLSDTLEWEALGYARSGADTTTFAKRYLSDAATFLKSGDAFGYGRTTDYSRVALAVTALGGDASNLDGYNILTQLSDFATTTKQGLNGAVFALLAVDANPDYQFTQSTVAGGTSTTKQNLVDYIMDKEMSDGGWNLYGSTSDVDITAMTLQALAPYKNQAKVKTAIDRAVQFLSTKQDANGGYTSYGTVNVESADQVVVALTALGINPTSADFTKNGKNLLDNILTFHIAGSGFSHTLGGAVNSMATEQSYYAIVAYNRYLNGQDSLYNMADAKTNTTTTTTDDDTTKPVATEGSTSSSSSTTSSSSISQSGNSSSASTASSSTSNSTNDNAAPSTSSSSSSANQPATKQQAAKENKSALPQLGGTVTLGLVVLGLALLSLTIFIGRKVRFNA